MHFPAPLYITFSTEGQILLMHPPLVLQKQFYSFWWDWCWTTNYSVWVRIAAKSNTLFSTTWQNSEQYFWTFQKMPFRNCMSIFAEMDFCMVASCKSMANFYFHLSYPQVPQISSDFTFLEWWVHMNDLINFKLLYEYLLACDLFIS